MAVTGTTVRVSARCSAAAAAALLYVLFIAVPVTQAAAGAAAGVRPAVPGTFFWKPRVELAAAVLTAYPRTVKKPTWENVHKSVVVVIRGYQVGLTVAAIAAMFDKMKPFPHLSPMSAYYYTDMYRWVLRYVSLISEWLEDSTKSYAETHKVWRKRYFYMDKFVPQWLRKILFFVDEKEWKKEEQEWPRFERYTEPAFGKYYRYPTRVYNDFNSFKNKDTVENLDWTNASLQ